MKEDYKMKKKKGLLIVISGPSGIGKTTIRERLVKENDDFWYSISMTTRKPRKIEKTNKYEQNGIDYYFVDEDEFISNIKENNFLEYAEVYKELYYGTLKDIVFKKLDEGINVILEIDVNGAKQVRKNYKNALLIFIKPRSLEELEYRLRNRRTDTEDAIKERLEKAIYEISNSGIYDYVIESGSKEEDYEKVKNIICVLLCALNVACLIGTGIFEYNPSMNNFFNRFDEIASSTDTFLYCDSSFGILSYYYPENTHICTYYEPWFSAFDNVDCVNKKDIVNDIDFDNISFVSIPEKLNERDLNNRIDKFDEFIEWKMIEKEDIESKFIALNNNLDVKKDVLLFVFITIFAIIIPQIILSTYPLFINYKWLKYIFAIYSIITFIISMFFMLWYIFKLFLGISNNDIKFRL
mgnify:CR=1 FL=1